MLECSSSVLKALNIKELNKIELYFSLIYQFKESIAHVKTQMPSILWFCHLQYVAFIHLVQDGSPLDPRSNSRKEEKGRRMIGTHSFLKGSESAATTLAQPLVKKLVA